MRMLATILFLAMMATPFAGVTSLDTGYTIQKVRTGRSGTDTFIAASSYEGTVLRVDFAGTTVWRNELTGFMIHDLWCDDLTGDGIDDVLAANADGYVYCLDGTTGRQLWSFTPTNGPHKTPMYAVCTAKDVDGTKYVACGGYDKSFYWLSATGRKLKGIASSTYSQDRPWGSAKAAGFGHTVNFLRPVAQKDGSSQLALCGTMSHMQSPGSMYRFLPLADAPNDRKRISGIKTCSDFTVCDANGDGTSDFIFGGSGLTNDPLTVYNPEAGGMRKLVLRGNGPNGYRISLCELIEDEGKTVYLALTGAHVNLIPLDLDASKIEKIGGTYAFNDLWKDPWSGELLLASAQSGGSCIHVIDPSVPDWKDGFKALDPPGKIRTIKANTAKAFGHTKRFKAPEWERDPVPVYVPGSKHPVAQQIAGTYDRQIFMGGWWHRGRVEKTDWRHQPESYVANDRYRQRKDKRNKYVLSQEEVLTKLLPAYEGKTALDFWAGHGNGPLYYSPSTLQKVLEGAKGKKTIMAWPELESHDDDFRWVVENILYPLAEECAKHDAWMVFKNKDVFWSTSPYLPLWRRMLSGEFADVFCSSMEETTDKTQDLSIAGRMGLWAAGSMNQWGMRTSRDNPSFDRSRQFSYQRLPSHFLRTTIYNLACGATYCGLTYVDDDYSSVLWPLLAKGALFVPKREEIVSFSPVHLSMVSPDKRYMDEGKNKKWTIFYDEQREHENPLVFSHMNGSWPAAALTEWDFSRYASGLRDRRQNFMPPFPYGIVLITPPQQGRYANQDAPRGKLTDHLHPLYRNIMKEYITDGRNYRSADGTRTYSADGDYYKSIEAEIRERAELLPLTVSGDNVAWVCAQTAPKHLRLTLIDGGYLNPGFRKAQVRFHTVKAAAITDLLDGSSYKAAGDSVEVGVPLGLFRFIDIELKEPLQ
jgi:lambda-carrageenase